MRLRLPHAPYVANKIAIDLFNAPFVKLTSGIEPVAKAAQEVLEEELKKEAALDEHVREIIEENEEEIEFNLADTRELFKLIKKRLAPEYGVILDFEDKYNDMAHKILKRLYEEDLILYDVPDNKVKNVIFDAIMNYIKSYDEIEDVVLEKISHYKKKLIPGTEEFELVFQRMFEDELRRRGMLQ
ncbi:hypothetical protein NitYY0826_C1839 [Nitratiruptor sp. YY08-26]|uniref:DUF507 family protein n=1 Tax=unclassified Nitratiruptor TaxID=2624044 RepID=UPI00191629BB|nr:MULTISPECIES: DUF507 family protein [unclassified Nitratiruptor]BCD62951.1 hypothetical protein NitYY0813_C1837 [Nitratiruptor sp. YY08-13]BCD66886.1 hypothetical protein NitYY0826_C1839 [Nitratiruptor sp. YY08-26]